MVHATSTRTSTATSNPMVALSKWLKGPCRGDENILYEEPECYFPVAGYLAKVNQADFEDEIVVYNENQTIILQLVK